MNNILAPPFTAPSLLTELGLLNGVNLQKDVDAKRKTRARDIAASVRKRTLLRMSGKSLSGREPGE
jgi:hypothetical protein